MKMPILKNLIATAACAACALFLSSAAPVAAKPSSALRIFPTANGVINYRMTMKSPMVGNALNRSDIKMTWIKNGARFRQDMTMNASTRGRKMTMKSWSIFDGKSFYSAMDQPSGRKVAMKMTLSPDYLKQLMSGNSGMMSGMKGVSSRVVGRGVVLGKMCEVRAMNINQARMNGQVKMWMWNKLPLRTESTMTTTTRDSKGKKLSQKMAISMVATQLNTNVNPSPSLFRLPAGYTVQDMSAMQKQMMQRMKQR